MPPIWAAFLAEREGFEPSVPLPVRQFSKLFLSATQASLLKNKNPLSRTANIANQSAWQKIFLNESIIYFLLVINA